MNAEEEKLIQELSQYSIDIDQLRKLKEFFKLKSYQTSGPLRSVLYEIKELKLPEECVKEIKELNVQLEQTMNEIADKYIEERKKNQLHIFGAIKYGPESKEFQEAEKEFNDSVKKHKKIENMEVKGLDDDDDDDEEE